MANGPGILSAIGRGLSLGGGVLNPRIFEQQQQERAQERLRAQQMDQQRKNALFQLILSAAQEGAIPGDEATNALKTVNPELFANLPEGVLGPSLETREKLEQKAARAQFAESLQDPRAQAAVRAGEGSAATRLELGRSSSKSEFEKLLAAKEAAQAAGDMQRAAAIDQRLRKLSYIRPPQQSAGDQRDRKIRALMDQGLGRSEATNIVDRNIDIEINPNTGRVVLTDLTTRQVTELPIGSESSRRADVPQSETLYSAAQQGVTGAIPGVQEFGSGITGQVGLPVAEDVIERRQNIRTAQGEMIRALSINPKMPVAEIKRIQKEIDIAPSFLDSKDALLSRMRSIDKGLRRRLAQAQRDASDPNLPEDLRSSQAQNAAAIRNFLDQLGVPQNDDGWKIEVVP